MRRIGQVLALLGANLALASCFSTASEAQAPAPAEPKRLIAGHRGTTVGADENTLSAMSYAHRAGADILEADVRLTSDKKMVIMHDRTLTRTTDCSGAVSDRTLTYVKGCRTARGHHPPSLRQLLQWAGSKGRLQLYLELKDAWTQTQVQRFV